MVRKITIYTKFCLPCQWPAETGIVNRWADKYKFKVKVVRTTYRPAKHAKASELWGSDSYQAFVNYHGINTRFVDFVDECAIDLEEDPDDV